MQILFCGHLWSAEESVMEILGSKRHLPLLRQVREQVEYREKITRAIGMQGEMVRVGTYGFLHYVMTPEMLNVDAILASYDSSEGDGAS